MKIVKVSLVVTIAFALAAAPLVAADSVATAKPSANLDLARQLNEAFVQVAAQVSPAVVVITVTEKPGPSDDSAAGPEGDDENDPFDHVPPEWRRFFRQEHAEPNVGQGSGIIIRENGYILTNRHVVEDADKIDVQLQDGRLFKGTVVGVDAPSDVAVIKIEAKNLTIAKLADSSKTRVGEFAIAIGAPFSLDYTVTFGHVSAKDRSNIIQPDPDNPTLTDQEFIQTDANINPGNSGGPLVNIDGEVIGINTLIRGLHTGIGFAIPSNLARQVAEQLIATGKFTRAWLGIGIKSLREFPDYREQVPNVQDGVVVRSIDPAGPASKSTLRPGDVITAIDGVTVITSQQLKDEVRSKRVGQSVQLDVFRKVRDEITPIKVTVIPGEWDGKDATSISKATPPGDSGTADASLGLTVKAMTHDLADQYNVQMTPGVIVTAVDKDGLADMAEIQPGDVITSVNQQSVANLQQFRDALKKANVKKGVIVNLVSGGTARFEILKAEAE